MRDESEWRRLSNAFPTSLLRSVSRCLLVCVCACKLLREHKKSIESRVKDEEHCLRRAPVMLCAPFFFVGELLALARAPSALST